MKNQAFRDGQTFYIPAPGCDEKIRWQMLEDDIGGRDENYCGLDLSKHSVDEFFGE